MPTMTPRDAMRLAETELSYRSRIGHVALLLAALGMSAVVAALWITEPALPLRTRVAFAVMTLIGLAWSGFALRVLTHRRALLASHAIMAGRMAVTFAVVFVVGALAVGYATGERAGYAAAGLGVVMVGAAAGALWLAHRRFARLTARRRELEAAVRPSAPPLP